MKYPLRNEYDTAIKHLDKFVFDSILKQGKPVMQTQNANFLRSYNGGKAIVYEIQTKTKKYALKCWVEDIGDLKNRYNQIDNYLQKCQLPYFVDFSYNEQGISVNGSKFPIVRMEWIDGISFKRFIANNIKNPVHIRQFAEKFLEMVKALHQKQISHGDLQHGNIIVHKDGKIYLIDYDSLYVPQLINEKDNIKGLPGYQHPNRNKLSRLSPKSDYFSELVIYLSLITISENPRYWQNIEKEERLLFSDTDLAEPNSSKIFSELNKLSPEIQYFTKELENFCREPNIENLQPLEALVNTYTGIKVSWDFVSNANLNVAPLPLPPVSTSGNNSVWDFKPTQPTQPTQTTQPTNSINSNIWDKFETNTNIWNKFDNAKPVNNHVWDKISSPQEPTVQPRKSATTTNENVWDKLVKSVSSIWDRIIKWFTT